MRRWVLMAALALPLPFAALPLVAVLSAGETAADGPAAFVRPTRIDVPEAAAASTEPVSLGMRIQVTESPGCDGLDAEG